LSYGIPPATAIAVPAPQVEAARQQFAGQRGWEPLLGAWERLGALLIQLALTVLVLQAFLRGRRWWWYALAAHTVVVNPGERELIAAGRPATRDQPRSVP
jgi:hypothetical protein